ncbi:glycosyltransferase family 2 protein [Fictibacillus enclensis]|uniref:Glycosyltransferase n=1 Tax=Fictibacillus enclensis TaxID=1017270 RepID=A0A0V8JC90_9BACL|nr:MULTISPECIES: glycosyltransferase family 2 protein [Fictibacillus]KSU84654.1 glycosyltransferase [Fictibacillus enclensis]MDM5198389.1 glycosyltransferase family 2 protein [Fictibacillus enclensis]MDM5337592.1 glycosyltransferase family 2 protein [Fictibacillus enclensis]RXY99695.1 glycosyltransferase [Fictibacillus sp. S7]WHY73960.1 glycosyltransferase family 2 protein [Fictibacillus enclensis]
MQKNKPPVLAIVVPCYNEEEVLMITARELTAVVQGMISESLVSMESAILFVDDGSQDKTWELITAMHKTNRHVSGVKLAKNAGHQNALLAGMDQAKNFSDCIISIDADLQDDVNVIREFILKYRDGYDVVYGIRSQRKSDTMFKRQTAQVFYKLMSKLGVELIYNHADYRLLSKRALKELERYDERNFFMRGIVPLIGFPSAQVYYDRKERAAGESKYPLGKMLAFAFDGITSFSIKPIRFLTACGFLFFFISAAAGLFALFQKMNGYTVPGWTSIVLSLWLIGGLQLMAIGLIGEYVGKVFKEVKKRPRYCIESGLHRTALHQKRTSETPLRTRLRSSRKLS